VDAVERSVEPARAAVGIEERQLPTLREKPLAFCFSFSARGFNPRLA
jgi:hypothetical protein